MAGATRGPASVVVRVKDEAATLARALDSLRAQTVEVEIVVVDSGSTDGSLAVAEQRADRVLRIPPERFSYGYALNVGAAACSTPVHFALSAHCVAPARDWVERTLSHYDRAEVGAVTGAQVTPYGDVLTAPWVQTLEQARAVPFWGFSNHGSSWREEVWRTHRFDERLDYAEDKEWALRVLAAGWEIVFDPVVHVDMTHQWRGARRHVFRRQRRAHRALASFTELPPYPVGALARDAARELRDGRRHALRPILGHMGRYVGQREARLSTRRGLSRSARAS